MKKRTKENLFLLFSVLVFIAALLFSIPPSAQKETMQITAITADTSEESGQSMLKQGMEQAALDYGAELTFRTLKNKEDMGHLLQMIDKEREGQTQALILEPTDKPRLAEKLSQASEDFPVYLINSSFTSSQKFPVIAADNFELGKKLGKQIAASDREKRTILVLKENFEHTETYDYYQGIIGELKKKNIAYDIRDVRGDNQELQIKLLLAQKDYYGIVSFTPPMLELLGKIKSEEQHQNLHLFGFQKSHTALALIDNGTVDALGVSNQFAVGYAAVQQAALQKSGFKELPEIQQMIVNRMNLFSEENQKLLFPVVQ